MRHLSTVMPGLVPGTHAVMLLCCCKRSPPLLAAVKHMDTRDKRGHDAVGWLRRDASSSKTELAFETRLSGTPQDEGF
jgi:hypothetical protein